MPKLANIILIGDGAIGSSFAFNCLTSGVGQSLGIIDINHLEVVSSSDLTTSKEWNGFKAT